MTHSQSSNSAAGGGFPLIRVITARGEMLAKRHKLWSWASVRACSFVFELAAAPRSTMSSPLPYCRTNQTSSDVGMIGMITASARHRRPCRQRKCLNRHRLARTHMHAREKSLKNFHF